MRAAIATTIRYGRPDDYIVTSRQRIEAISDARIRAAAQRLRPDALTWVVVGDLEQIQAPVRALDLGPVQVLDSDGHAVTAPETGEDSTTADQPAAEPPGGAVADDDADDAADNEATDAIDSAAPDDANDER